MAELRKLKDGVSEDEIDRVKAGLKASLRQDTNIVLVGEMRDLETIALALTAAETGLLVFGTLHTNNARKTVDRMVDAFPADRQVPGRALGRPARHRLTG